MAGHRRFPDLSDTDFAILDATERRARISFAEHTLLADRQRRRCELSSMDKTPTERIKLWEELHALSLPRKHDHQLIRVIARQTELSVDQVREEQSRRGA